MDERLNFLFNQQLLAKNSAAEKQELLELLANEANDEQAAQLLLDYWERFEPQQDRILPITTEEKILEQLLTETSTPVERKLPYSKLISYGLIAAAVTAIALFIYFFAGYPKSELNSASPNVADIAPGRQGATITLANGKTIQLDSAKSGVIVSNTLKYDDNTLVIQSDSEGTKTLGTRDDNAQQLTASTAKGQTYTFTLPDGTKVWLNADSKLTFPATFVNAANRIVTATGEAYFEVAKDKKHPFIVKTDGQQVEVLGTHFNINAYADEGKIRTTLIEGSVSVTGINSKDTQPVSANAIILKPNQQAVLADNRFNVTQIDPELAIAWKNNKFIFADERLEVIMRMVARWYNIDVVYTGEITKEHFGGSVSRYENLMEVLKPLQATGEVKFKLEGRRLMVSK